MKKEQGMARGKHEFLHELHEVCPLFNLSHFSRLPESGEKNRSEYFDIRKFLVLGSAQNLNKTTLLTQPSGWGNAEHKVNPGIGFSLSAGMREIG